MSTNASPEPSACGGTCDCAWVDALARTHARRLCAVARREGLSADDALDAVQDGFAVFLRRPDVAALHDRPDDAGRVLAAMVRSAARNLRRRHHRSRPHVDADAVPLAADEPTSVEQLASADDAAQLAGCVAALGATQQQVVRLRLLEEVSGAEAAAALGLLPGHVAVLLHRARAQLASCMARDR